MCQWHLLSFCAAKEDKGVRMCAKGSPRHWCSVVSKCHIMRIKPFSSSPRAAKKNKARAFRSAAASRHRAAKEETLAIKQGGIGFLRPNESSPWEIDEWVRGAQFAQSNEIIFEELGVHASMLPRTSARPRLYLQEFPPSIKAPG